MLDAIEEENKIGVFAIEIDERPEVVASAIALISGFFTLYGWAFNNFSQASREYYRATTRIISITCRANVGKFVVRSR